MLSAQLMLALDLGPVNEKDWRKIYTPDEVRSNISNLLSPYHVRAILESDTLYVLNEHETSINHDGRAILFY